MSLLENLLASYKFMKKRVWPHGMISPMSRFTLNPVLIDKLKIPDKKKEDVNGSIYRLLMTAMLAGNPLVIIVIANYIQVLDQIHIPKRLLAGQMAYCCQMVKGIYLGFCMHKLEMRIS